ncbi:Protein FAR1-RELATED SEQUENCE 5 [Glycine soja]|uniref:Protein FAR1-RELATED SEQUENCE 5 n=1 Tax=Glycine soja TaxID=3848 RepID=A0A0B2PZF8_GLYSO|nr:Protein FAR1-RELATED SEQUENCE 5 [Glycine soja]
MCKVRSPVNVMDLDDIMSELESSDNFCSFVNGDGDNDVTEVYPNDDDDQHDVRLEDEDEVDSEVHNDDGGDYDDFWIPGLLKEECISIDSMIDIRQFDMEEITDEAVRRLDFGDLELAYQFYCWYAKREFQHQIEGCSEKKKKAGVVVKQCFVFMCIFVQDDGHRKMFAFDIMQVENYRKVGIRPPHMHATFANQCGGYDKVWFIRKDIYNEEGRMRKQHTSDGSGALKYLHDLRKKDPMMDVLAFDATYKENKYLCPFVVFTSVSNHNQTIVFAAAVVTDETEETYVWLLEQLLVAMKGKTPSSIITDGYLAMRNAITRIMLGVFHRLCAWHLLRNALSHVRDKQVLKWLKKEFEEKWKEMVATFELEDNTWIAELTIKLRVVDCKEMVAFSIYTVVKYCSGSVWLVSYCPSTVDFSRSCMRMKSIGLPCDHILVVLVSLNFMELPSSLVLSKWSKVATENIKDKYLDSAMYWDSQLMARYATLVEVSRQVCEAAYCDEEEYDKMLHFLSNEARRLKSKKNRQPCVDDNND